MEQIIFDSEDGEQLPFFVIDETVIGEIRYLLVSDEDPDGSAEGEASILKCVSSEDEEDVYEFVEDDAEWDAVLSVFQELSDDYDFEDVSDEE